MTGAFCDRNLCKNWRLSLLGVALFSHKSFHLNLGLFTVLWKCLFQNVLKLSDKIKGYVDKPVRTVVRCRCRDVLNGELATPKSNSSYMMTGGIDITMK